MTSHLEVNHLQITCWRILGNKAKKGDFNYRGNIDEGMFNFLLSFYFSQDLNRSSYRLKCIWFRMELCTTKKREMGDTKEKGRLVVT